MYMKSIKYNVSWMLALCITAGLQAQTMRWTPVSVPSEFGKCSFSEDKEGKTQCYVLEYVPAVSGVLTSYTAGFFVSCTSLGSAISENQSCSMSSNVRLVNGCSSVGQVLMSSSGNTGSAINNKIEAGVPVVLHQVCLTIPSGETVTIEEDPVTDLSTSVDVVGGTYATEYPSFETATFRRIRYDQDLLATILDFQARPAGGRVAQLDWSVSPKNEITSFSIERSFDGEIFEVIGELPALDEDQRRGIYQFLDRAAQPGDNFYRLRQIDDQGKEAFSPIRKIVFEQFPFTVTATPNPVKDRLSITFNHAKEAGTMSFHRCQRPGKSDYNI